ncbi:hypothetical protein AJ80_00957 [Polytolypa hystricis UAMH7299]|uniref:K Homology domain-containing protein n=1 Tax=Polytolypa hystricis (strain UAMH7299) TaxID=1447883 RepID=A0A2B7Z341_POLH7|nr:hypothetical protein AJ80_00957 [Polytolypa hystricis UAMH7299]
MGDQQNISQILAALVAQRPSGTPGQEPSPTQLSQLQQSLSGAYQPSAPPANLSNYPLPSPDNSGSLDISGVKPDNTGSVSIADAIAKARGIAAEKGIMHDPNRARGPDPRHDTRPYHCSPSPAESPARAARETYRDNYNPYRDERRGNGRDYARERSFSPRPAGRARENFSPPPGRRFRGPGDRSPPPPSRRMGAADDNVEMINIEANLVGLIIGRQGDNLRRIESDTGTRIQFLEPDPTGTIRLCKITGNKMARIDAKEEINRVITEGRGAPRPPLGGHAERPAARPQVAPLDDNTTQIMVPDRTVGLIIGRHGETIRDLQERSGCHVNIVSEAKSINGLRPVNLVGSPEATAKAKDFILEIVESDTRQLANAPQREPRGGYSMSGDAGGGTGERVTDSLMIPGDAVGMIIGKGGDTIKEIQASAGCRINIQPPTGRDSEREVTLTGPRHAIEQAKGIILEKLEGAEHRTRSQPPRREDPYSDRYSRPQHQPQPYYQESSGPSQPPPSAPQPAGGDSADPYASYGGYQNYLAIWYAAMAQQQQGGQGPPPPGAPGPPGV